MGEGNTYGIVAILLIFVILIAIGVMSFLGTATCAFADKNTLNKYNWLWNSSRSDCWPGSEGGKTAAQVAAANSAKQVFISVDSRRYTCTDHVTAGTRQTVKAVTSDGTDQFLLNSSPVFGLSNRLLDVACPSGQALSHVEFDSTNRRYKYTCCSGTDGGANILGSTTDKSSDVGSSWMPVVNGIPGELHNGAANNSTNWGEWPPIVLTQTPMDCGNGAIAAFKLTVPNDHKFKYDYKCAPATSSDRMTSCAQHSTDMYSDTFNLKGLNNHVLRCPVETPFLNSMKMVYEGQTQDTGWYSPDDGSTGSYKYTYTCCK